MRVFVALRLLGCNTSNNSTYFLNLSLDVSKIAGEAASEPLEEIFYIVQSNKIF